MPVQQQMSSFAKRLGGRVAQANAEHADKPIDTGNRRLPAGIRDGIAKLSTMYTKEYEDDKSFPGAKGQVFFRASAIVISPAEHNGEKIAGMVTSFVVPLCDKPAKGKAKAKSFSENWYEFQNVFKLLGVAPCPETQATDPTGQRTEAYFMAAMKTLTDPIRARTNPVFISFSTRGWTPPLTPQELAAGQKPQEYITEDWHGLAKFDGKVDPGAGVSGAPNAATQPDAMSPPPSVNGVPYQPPTAPPAVAEPTAAHDVAADYDATVASLVEVAMNDPEGATEEGADASAQLEKLAWGIGWTEEQTKEATDWAQVGDMALNPPTALPTQPATSSAPTAPPQNAVGTIVVGGKWMFAKRSKDGAKLKNNKGEEFPSQEVQVVTVDAAAKTCTVKTVKDGKDVVDIRTKLPVAAKFEWLEGPPY